MDTIISIYNIVEYMIWNTLSGSMDLDIELSIVCLIYPLSSMATSQTLSYYFFSEFTSYICNYIYVKS